MAIVTSCNGCFDGSELHPGHLMFLGYCRGQGDSLVVGVNSDSYIRRKKREPVAGEGERVRRLLMTGIVDWCIVFDEDDPSEFIREVKPGVHCTGAEYIGRCPEARVCQELGVSLVFVPRFGLWSTTKQVTEFGAIGSGQHKVYSGMERFVAFQHGSEQRSKDDEARQDREVREGVKGYWEALQDSVPASDGGVDEGNGLA